MFPDPVPKELTERARKQLRSRMRAVRAAYPDAALQARSARILERVVALPEYHAATSVALFYPLPKEVDLRPLDVRAREDGKRVHYPVMDPRENGFSTGLAVVDDVSELEERGRRFLEPPPTARRITRGEVDLIVVPALAVSSTGHRLGYGVGFYDSTLPDFCPPALSVAVAFDFQLLAELPTFEHDFPCARVVTDARTLGVE